MYRHRRAEDRFHTRTDWLDSRHSFAFGHHYHPDHLGFRSLRVINDDRVAPGAGFPAHGHRNMEIVSYVVEGSLAHQDSSGGRSTIEAGQLQRMSAGRGVRHSEFNGSSEAPVRFLQIWIEPAELGLDPGYEELRFGPSAQGALQLLAAPKGREGALELHQDAEIWGARLSDGQSVEHELRAGRGAWVQVVRGAARVGDYDLDEGDGLAVEDEERLIITGVGDAEILLFDLA